MKKCLYFILFFIFFVIFSQNVWAIDVKITSAEMVEKSDKTSIIEALSFEDLKLKFGVRFVDKGDYIKYKLIITNNDDEDYYLSLNDNDEQYFKYQLNINDNVIKANSDNELYFVLQYNNSVDIDDFDFEIYEKDISIILPIVDKNGKPIYDDVSNPSTSYLGSLFLVLGGLVIISLGLYMFKKKYKFKGFIVYILFVSIISYNLVSALVEISLESNVRIEVITNRLYEQLLNISSESDDYTEIDDNIDESLLGDNKLKSLIINDVSILKDDVNVYNLNYDSSIDSFSLKFLTNYFYSTVNVVYNDSSVIDIDKPFSLNPGMNNLSIYVKAPNDDVNIYSINIYRNIRVPDEEILVEDPSSDINLSDNNNLKSLKIDCLDDSNSCSLSNFRPDVTSYTVNVSYDVESLSVDAIADDENAIVSYNKNVELNIGNNVINIYVKSQKGNVKKYIINVKRNAPSSDNNLKMLKVGGVDYSSSLSKTTINIEVPYTTKSINVDAEANNEFATIKISKSTLSLNVGSNQVIITVTAQSKAVKKYVVNITRKDADLTLKSLSITNGSTNYLTKFNSSTETYSITVPSNVDTLNINAVLSDTNCSITKNIISSTTTKIKNNSITNLNYGQSSLSIVVSIDGKSKEYIININRSFADSSNEFNIYFLNTQKVNNVDYVSNQSVILQSKDGSNKKYVLLDTGDKDENIVNVIYNKLYELQKPSNGIVKIDYLIISHPHADHNGNFKSILGNSKFKVTNVIYKSTNIGKVSYPNITKDYSNVNFIDVLSKSEGYSINISSSLSLKFYNVSDVFSSSSIAKKCSNIPNASIDGTTGYETIRFSSSINDKNKYKFIKYKGKYVCLQDPYDINNKNLVLRDSFSNYKAFCAYTSTVKNVCNANANSIAVLATYKTSKGDKYIYLPSDLENNGYSLWGVNGIYSNNATTVYTNVKLENGVRTIDLVSKGSGVYQLPSYNTSYTVNVPSENNVARKVISDINGKTSNIVIYAQTHHSFNNAADALSILNLNRSDLWAISTSKYTSERKGKDYYIPTLYISWKGNNVTLSKANLLSTALYSNGVRCVVQKSGDYSCFPQD